MSNSIAIFATHTVRINTFLLELYLENHICTIEEMLQWLSIIGRGKQIER
jgi:hypothetical protein